MRTMSRHCTTSLSGGNQTAVPGCLAAKQWGEWRLRGLCPAQGLLPYVVKTESRMTQDLLPTACSVCHRTDFKEYRGLSEWAKTVAKKVHKLLQESALEPEAEFECGRCHGSFESTEFREWQTPSAQRSASTRPSESAAQDVPRRLGPRIGL